MEALLCSQGLEGALEQEDKTTNLTIGREVSMMIEKQEKTQKEINKKAYNMLILSLGDKVLREVSKWKTVAKIWKKLEDLYLKKTLSNCLYLKARFFNFKMQEPQNLHEHIDEFNKLCLDLENI